MQRYIEKAKKTFWSTDEKDFRGLLDDGLGFAFAYFLGIFLIGFVLNLIVMTLSSGGNLAAAILMGAFVFVSYAVGPGIILPAATFILLFIMAKKPSIDEVFQMYFYGATPSMLMSWVPCIGVFTPLVSFGNVFRGIREIKKLSFFETLIAVLVPALIYWGFWMFFIVGVITAAGGA